MAFVVYVSIFWNPTVLVAADNAIKVSYLAREVDVPYFTSVTFLFCRSVTLGLQNSVISYQESVSTRPPRSLALQGGWLQRYAYSIGKGGWGRAWYVYPFLVYFTLHSFTHSYMFCFVEGPGKQTHIEAVWRLLLCHSDLGAPYPQDSFWGHNRLLPDLQEGGS